MKYKIGDKVRINKVEKVAAFGRKKCEGQIVTIRSINPNGETAYNETHYGVKEDIPFIFLESELVPVNTKKIVITSDGVETLARLYEGNKVVKTATAKCSPEDTFDFEVGARYAFDRLVEQPITKALKKLRASVQQFHERFENKTAATKPLKIEKGKKYLLKPYDDVEDHLHISKETWDKIAKRYVLVRDIGGHVLADTCYNGAWFFDPEAFEKEYVEKDTPKYYNGKAVCLKSDKDFTVGKIYEFVDGRTTDNGGSKRPVGYAIEKSFDVWEESSGGIYKFLPIVE